jgi:hypothetical protein
MAADVIEHAASHRLRRVVLEPVPNTADRGDQIGKAQLLADVPQVNIDDTHFPKILATPDLLQKLLT